MNTRVAYVVKRYPRFSETFIVNEILAHEAAGLPIELFSLRPPVDTHFQDLISRVRAPLTYLSEGQIKAAELWEAMRRARRMIPDLPALLATALESDAVLDVYCGIQLAVHCLKRKVTHIHAHFASSPATVARIASSLTGIPFSITAHAKDIFHETVDSVELERKLRSAKVTFTVSEFNLAFLNEHFPTARDRVIRLYNGMHLRDFQATPCNQRAPKIVAVGRFVEKKGFQDLVTACGLLRDRGVAYECQLVGGGELETELAKSVERLGLAAQVQLLGPQPQSVVKNLISQASVMAAPCVHGEDGNCDGLPTVLLEAMALGTPCVSTAVTGIPEVVKHDATGIIVGEHAPEQLASALAELLHNPERRTRLADAARALIESEFDIERNTQVQRDYFENSTCDGMQIHSGDSRQLAEVR